MMTTTTTTTTQWVIVAYKRSIDSSGKVEKVRSIIHRILAASRAFGYLPGSFGRLLGLSAPPCTNVWWICCPLTLLCGEGTCTRPLKSTPAEAVAQHKSDIEQVSQSSAVACGRTSLSTTSEASYPINLLASTSARHSQEATSL